MGVYVVVGAHRQHHHTLLKTGRARRREGISNNDEFLRCFSLVSLSWLLARFLVVADDADHKVNANLVGF